MDFNKNVENNQKIALNINNSIWVSASAGSGKTTILVSRLLVLLLSDIDLSKIVCITYTKTGANEMKTRIYNELASWVVLNDTKLEFTLKKLFKTDTIQKSLIQKARVLFAKIIDNIEELRILTIHAFCQQILKRFPLEAGILPNFDIIEDSKELIKQSTDELLTNINNYPELLEKLKIIIQHKNEEQFYELINNILNEQQTLSIIQDFNYDYKTDLYHIFNINTDKNQNDYLDEFCKNDGFIDVNYYDNNIANTLTDKQQELFNYLNKWKNFDYEERKNNYDKYLNIFLTASYEKKSFKTDKRMQKIVKNETFAEQVFAEQDRCFDFYQNFINTQIADLTIFSIEFGLAILNIYKKNKDKKGLLDYNDLIVYTLNLLKNSENSDWINYKMDNGIEHILLDEAQDTSKIQWQIVKSLTAEFFAGDDGNEKNRTIFVVGDEKQSIFKFQGASPDMFGESYLYYKNLINDARKYINKVNLEYSFRSLPNILTFTDKVFETDKYAKRISNVSPQIKHNCMRFTEKASGKVELWPLIEIKKEEEKPFEFSFEKDNETVAKELLAEDIAMKIRDLTSSNKVITIKEEEKNIEYKDIMILFRTRDEVFISYLVRKLNEFKIPNTSFDKTKINNNIIIQDIVSVFEFVLFPENDLNLAVLFKSPILNLQEEDLFFVCQYKKFLKKKLFETLQEIVKNNDNYENFVKDLQTDSNFPNFKMNIDKYQYVINILNDFAAKSNELTIYDLCSYIIDNYDIKQRFLERFGDDFEEILKQFLNYIKNYEKNNTINLFNFLQKMKKNDIEIKKDMDASSNQVKLMTVYGSKGMQAPIVFLVNAPINTGGNKNHLLWTEKLFDYKTPIFSLSNNNSVLFDRIKNNINDDNYSEYLRLFYVGITRAENELYICGWKNGNEKKTTEEKDENKLTWYDLSKLAMKELGREEKFEFSRENNDENKIVFCSDKEEFGIINEKNDIVKNINKNILKNHKKLDNYEKVNGEEEDFQFLKHLDRDNNILTMNIAIAKGNAVHKLLEILPSANVEDRDEIADIYLNNSFFILSNEDRKIIKEKVFNILNNPEYATFFDKNSKSEVDIIGNLDGKNTPKRIDRLVIKEDKIIIIDYKNTMYDYNEKTLPIEYKQQLNGYKTLIEQIYKNKKVECYILLTSFIKLIKVY